MQCVWDYRDQVVDVTRPVHHVRLSAGMAHFTGRVEFDGLALVAYARSGESAPALASARGVFGDPHLVSIDGAAFDFHRVGEFELLSDDSVVAQARYSASGPGTITTAFGVASVKTSSRLFIDGPTVHIDSLPVEFGAGHQVSAGDWFVSRTGELCNKQDPLQFAVLGRDGHSFTVGVMCNKSGAHVLRVMLRLPAQASGTCAGLLGNCNGDAADDETDEDTLAAMYAVTEATSIMHYHSGEGVATFVDAAWRATGVAEETPEAVAACADLVGAVYKACIYDVSVLGDLSFAEDLFELQSDMGLTTLPIDLIFGGEGIVEATGPSGRYGRVLAVVSALGVGVFLAATAGAFTMKRVRNTQLVSSSSRPLLPSHVSVRRGSKSSSGRMVLPGRLSARRGSASF